MTDTVIKFGDTGLAAFQTGGFTGIEPFSGPAPINVKNFDIDPAAVAAAAMPIFSVVGLGANGLTYATEDKTVQALGVTVAPVDAGVSAANVGVFMDGTFNLAALTWDASYDTDAKKADAFVGAPTPTVIFIKKPLYE